MVNLDHSSPSSKIKYATSTMATYCIHIKISLLQLWPFTKILSTMGLFWRIYNKFLLNSQMNGQCWFELDTRPRVLPYMGVYSWSWHSRKIGFYLLPSLYLSLLISALAFDIVFWFYLKLTTIQYGPS